MQTYYRLVCFDKDGKFSHLSIEHSLDDAIKKRRKWTMKLGVVENDYRYTNIFKCNEKGNNYTGREVYV